MFNVPGRPTGSLRGPRSWFSLFAHRHLHVISDSFSPQFGVQENPRARECQQCRNSVVLAFCWCQVLKPSRSTISSRLTPVKMHDERRFLGVWIAIEHS